MKHMDNFKQSQKVRSILSLKGLIFLINEYIDVDSKIDLFIKDIEDKSKKLSSIRTTIDVLKEHNTKIPEELTRILSELNHDLNRVNREYQGYNALLNEISEITSIKNLRYLVGNISEKENLSLQELSIKIGCNPSVLDKLNETSEIENKNLEKLINYYGINEVVDSWSRYLN